MYLNMAEISAISKSKHVLTILFVSISWIFASPARVGEAFICFRIDLSGWYRMFLNPISLSAITELLVQR